MTHYKSHISVTKLPNLAENLAPIQLAFLKGIGYTWLISAILTREKTFATSCLLPCTPESSKKKSTLKGKNAPNGSKVLLFRVYPS